MAQEEGQPAVTRIGLFATQVCVPKDWTDDQVNEYAEKENPCGTTRGWRIRRDDPERAQCEKFPSHVHITLDA